MPVVVEHLVVRDGARDEARDEAVELLRVHRLGVVLHHAEELLAADEEAERVLVADVDDAGAEPSGLRDELVLEGAEHRRRSGVRDDRAGGVRLDRPQPGQVLRRLAPDVVGEGATRREKTAPVLEAEQAIGALRGEPVVLCRDGDGRGQRDVVRGERAG